eukprot:4045457-Prymnesium_polylepis.1
MAPKHPGRRTPRRSPSQDRIYTSCARRFFHERKGRVCHRVVCRPPRLGFRGTVEVTSASSASDSDRARKHSATIPRRACL